MASLRARMGSDRFAPVQNCRWCLGTKTESSVARSAGLSELHRAALALLAAVDQRRRDCRPSAMARNWIWVALT